VNIDGQQLESFDIANPYYGPTSSTVDLWAGYTRKLSRRINWRIQLNVRNAFGKNELIPINAQPDGGPAAFRIMTRPTWSITNTFDF
jgi:outer membrane receptor protein involved in Fe transport